jgi:hypothetical protein
VVLVGAAAEEDELELLPVELDSLDSVAAEEVWLVLVLVTLVSWTAVALVLDVPPVATSPTINAVSAVAASAVPRVTLRVKRAARRRRSLNSFWAVPSIVLSIRSFVVDASSRKPRACEWRLWSSCGSPESAG